jgi:hypothetical protein
MLFEQYVTMVYLSLSRKTPLRVPAFGDHEDARIAFYMHTIVVFGHRPKTKPPPQAEERTHGEQVRIFETVTCSKHKNTPACIEVILPSGCAVAKKSFARYQPQAIDETARTWIGYDFRCAGEADAIEVFAASKRQTLLQPESEPTVTMDTATEWFSPAG